MFATHRSDGHAHLHDVVPSLQSGALEQSEEGGQRVVEVLGRVQPRSL